MSWDRISLIFNKSNKNKDDNNRIIPISFFMGISILIGLIFITIGSLIEVKFVPTVNWPKEFRSLIVSLLYNTGQAFFIGGIVGMIFEMKSIKNYFEKRISDILIDDKYLIHQNHNELMRLRQRATKSFFMRKSNSVDSDLVDLDKKICEGLTEPYYDFYQESSTITFSDDKKYLIKKIKNRFKLVNPQDKEINLFDFLKPRIRFKNISGVDDSDIRMLKGFDVWIDSMKPQSIMEHIEVKTLPQEMYENDQDYKIITELVCKKESLNFSRNLFFKNSFEALIVEERKIPLDDLIYSFRLETSAKNFKIGLVFENNDNIELNGNLFGTMSNPRNGINIDIDSNSISIESKKWMLKGNGAYINIVPKNWNLVSS